MGDTKPHPQGCVCWNDPNWNCMVDICDSYKTESRDKLCDNCDHAAECHVAERATIAAERDEAIRLLRRWIGMLPPGLDLGRLPYAELRESTSAVLARLDARERGTE